jgi:16S rRNA (adenine1518-N6/adenine1519-N6)-dimethyltransferase
MAMYKPSELRQFLDGLGIHPKKSLSQNFLIDGNIINKIVKAADVQPGDLVVEIGSGPGSLTEALLKAGARVIAVEKDNLLAKELERLGSQPQLEVHCEDIMTFPLADTLAREGKKAKVIANLPYHLTTPIISLLVGMRDKISSIVVMVQEEVARRFIALPGTPDYGSYSLFLRFYTNPRYAFTVSRNCFYPVPNVESAVVRLDLKEPPAVKDEERFFLMTRTAFKQRRKAMRGSLREIYTPESMMNALATIGKGPLTRPEELSLEEFLELHKKLEGDCGQAV